MCVRAGGGGAGGGGGARNILRRLQYTPPSTHKHTLNYQKGRHHPDRLAAGRRRRRAQPRRRHAPVRGARARAKKAAVGARALVRRRRRLHARLPGAQRAGPGRHVQARAQDPARAGAQAGRQAAAAAGGRPDRERARSNTLGGQERRRARPAWRGMMYPSSDDEDPELHNIGARLCHPSSVVRHTSQKLVGRTPPFPASMRDECVASLYCAPTPRQSLPPLSLTTLCSRLRADGCGLLCGVGSRLLSHAHSNP